MPEVQAVKDDAASSLHSNTAPGSFVPNVNEADVLATLPDGPLVIDVSGAIVSTVHVTTMGLGSALPAASTARICTV